MGLTVVGNLLHEHNVGSALSFRHIRDGQELPPIEANEAYDFNFQQVTMFEDHLRRTLLPGDEFILDCVYDTTSRDGITFGGESSQQEMCLTFLWVYPASGVMDYCLEAPTETAYSGWAQEMFDAGYLTMHETTLNDLIDDVDSDVTQFGDIAHTDYEELGVTWSNLENADLGAEMFEKLYSEEAYAGRTQYCSVDRGAWDDVYDHQIADFVAYVADEAVCADDDVETSSAAAITVSVGSFAFLMLSTLL